MISNLNQLIEEINISNGQVSNLSVYIDKIDLKNLNYRNLSFYNCIFKNKITISEKHRSFKDIHFEECTFEGSIEIKNCRIEKLSFTNTISLKRLYINNHIYNKEIEDINIGEFRFENKNILNDLPQLSADFIIENTKFGEFCFFDIRHIEGKFRMANNRIGNKDSYNPNENISFGSSWIRNAFFSNNYFFGNVSFFRSILTFDNDKLDFYYRGIQFVKNHFENADFENTSFSPDGKFVNCSFYGKTNFRNFNNWMTGGLNFTHCDFHGYTNFEDGKAINLNFDYCNFNDITSFMDSIVENITLNRTFFLKTSYFDGFIIKIITNKKLKKIEKRSLPVLKRTIRQIKQELQKADNKIDYNRFKNYELALYYKELRWNGNFRDKFILATTWLATGFDHSWRRALVFTLSFGFLFYNLFFISERYYYTFDIARWREFVSGYFRFLLVTDFYNPLIKERVFLTEPLSWLIFILGKIFIAFGIYEMVQAFRKFKS